MSPALVASVVSGALAVVAAALLAWGLRGRRVDDHPICRRCGFDLFGRPAGSVVCSECGANLAARRAVRTGRRQRRTGAIAVALPALLIAILSLGVLGYGRAAGVDWNRRKPAWLLAREAGAAHAPTRDAAIRELVRRIEIGSLADADRDALERRALDHQADEARPWVTAWGELLEASRYANKLPPDRWDRYGTHAVTFELEVRRRVRRGDPIPYQIRRGPDRAAAARFRFHPNLSRDTLTLGGTDVRLYNSDSVQLYDANVPIGDDDHQKLLMTGACGPEVWEDLWQLAEGPQTAQFRVSLHGYRQIRPSMFEVEREPARVVTLEAKWTLLPEDQSSVRVNNDPSLRQAVERSLTLDRLEKYKPRRGRPPGEVGGYIASARPPIGLAYRARFRMTAPREWSRPVGEVWREADKSQWMPDVNQRYGLHVGGVVPAELLEHPDPRMDVVLTPDPGVAAGTLHVLEIWGGEVVLANVPVVREGTPRIGRGN